VQRCLTAKNEWHAKASMLLGAFLKMFIPVLVLFPGLLAIVLIPDLDDGDHALPQMVKKLLPPGMIGLMFSAFLAGLMSTIDSMLNSTATLWTKDIYEKFLKKDAPDRHYLFVGKLVTVVILLFGIATAPVSSYFPGIYVAIQTFLSFFQGPVFSILLLGIFWKKTTQWGGLSGLIVGMCVSALLYIFKGSFFNIEEPFLYVSWWSFLTGFIVTISVSLFTKPHTDERLSGLVYGLTDRKQNT
jgi:SSS family solute:Na+ symporter